MQGLENKVMIVTGASSGIGAALALEGLSRGMKVVMAARRMEPMEALVRGRGLRRTATCWSGGCGQGGGL
jgi:NADP-dependent 3-hydroxy acid dehydrogenase YdfG